MQRANLTFSEAVPKAPCLAQGPLSCMQTVALTFDDAPDPVNTAQVLDDLAAAGLKATFFVNTNNQMQVANSVEGQNLLKRMYSEGHTVGV